jgi:hypothetical protein
MRSRFLDGQIGACLVRIEDVQRQPLAIDHLVGQPDVGDAEIPDVCLARIEEESHLGQPECHGHIRLDRRPQHLRRIPVHPGWHVYRKDRRRTSIHHIDHVGIRPTHLLADTGAEEGVDDEIALFQSRFDLLLPPRKVEELFENLLILSALGKPHIVLEGIGREVLRLMKVIEPNLRPPLGEESRNDETVSRVVATSEHNGNNEPLRRSEFPDDAFENPLPGPLHQGKARNKALDRLFIDPLHFVAGHNVHASIPFCSNSPLLNR